MTHFSAIRFDEQALLDYQALFAACFPPSKKFEPDALRWLYVDNPDGCAVGFDAYEGEVLAAHYVCIPARAIVNGLARKVLLSLNTATHPAHQGKGLFTKLAEMTYTAGVEQGFSAIYGVANANSTPGFVRKLGFQLVAPLRAMVGVGGLDLDAAALSESRLQFRRHWTDESLQWRCANPVNPVRSYSTRSCTAFAADAFGAMLPAYAELDRPHRPPVERGDRLGTPARLYLGLMPAGASRFSGFINIPQRLRPSPLNLIFRSLLGAGGSLDADGVFFTFLDFDAY